MEARTAVLVIIDVQNGFITDGSRDVVPVIASLVEGWQNAGGDVVFTRYINYPGSPYERLIKWTALSDSPEIDIVAELLPYADKATAVVDKKMYSLFADEAGRALVAEHGWTDIYVCGIATESCVLKTAVDAFELDLTPWVIRDASASHKGAAVHDMGLFVTQRFIGEGQLINVADIPGYLTEAVSVSAPEASA
jgi:nicotinamidase-related amidase